MKLEYKNTLAQCNNDLNGKIQAISFSCIDDNYLAVANRDSSVCIYDTEVGDLLDCFCLKSNDMVRGLGFDQHHPSEREKGSNLEARLVVTQERELIVYKWSQKSPAQGNSMIKRDLFKLNRFVCNRFVENEGFMCASWYQTDDIVYGLTDGYVRIVSLHSNKFHTLFKSKSYMTSIAFTSSGSAFVSSHVDGTLYKCTLGKDNNSSYCLLFSHSSSIYTLSWGNSICFGDMNGKLFFLDNDGKCKISFDIGVNTITEKNGCCEISAVSFHPSGSVVAVGGYTAFDIFHFTQNQWKRTHKICQGKATRITCLAWSKNGNTLTVGSCTGLLYSYDFFVKRIIHRNNFEVKQIMHNEVMIKSSKFHGRFHSSMGNMIKGLKFFRDPIMKHERYIVLQTDRSIICMDMDEASRGVSEIEWIMTGSEKFIFDTPQAFLVSNTEEVVIVKHGSDKVAASIRTDYISPSLLSLRIDEVLNFVAYLLDKQTVCIKDLASLASVTIAHTYEIDFIELGSTGSLLLFRDKRHDLYLFDTEKREKSMLCGGCSYAQWVPESNVIVAQCHSQMFVWYYPSYSTEVVIVEIEGDIENIERSHPITQVITESGSTVRSYRLDDHLIAFNLSLDSCDFHKSLQIVHLVKPTSQKLLMCQLLMDQCVKDYNTIVAEQCASLLGDVSDARYLRHVRKLCVNTHSTVGRCKPNTSLQLYSEASLLKFRKDIVGVDSLYQTSNRLIDTIKFHEELLMLPKAISLFEIGDDGAHHKILNYIDMLATKNLTIALAQVYIAKGDIQKAVNVLTCSGMIMLVSTLILKNSIIKNALPTSDVECVIKILLECCFYEEAGDVSFYCLQKAKLSFEHYLNGSAYTKAIDIAKKYSFGDVVALERRCADHLASMGMIAEAIRHYSEAHDYENIIRLYLKVGDNLSAEAFANKTALSDRTAIELAVYYTSILAFDKAEKYFGITGNYKAIIDNYISEDYWEDANRIAHKYLTGSESESIIDGYSEFLGRRGLLDSIKANFGIDHRTISIYHRHRQFDALTSILVSMKGDRQSIIFEPILVSIIDEGNICLIERLLKTHELSFPLFHIVSVLNDNRLYEESVYLACSFHGKGQGMEVFLKGLDVADCVQSGELDFMDDLNLIDAAIFFLLKNFQIPLAVELANRFNKLSAASTADVQFKVALSNQDFNLADKIVEQEATIDVKDDLRNRLKLIEAYNSFKEGNLKRMETCFLAINKADLAIDLLIRHNHLDRALSFALSFLPTKIDEVKALISKQHNTVQNAVIDLSSPTKDQLDKTVRSFSKIQDETQVLKEMIRNKLFDDAIQYISTLPLPHDSSFYYDISIGILGRDLSFECNFSHQRLVSTLKSCLRQVCKTKNGFASDLEKILLVAHYTEMMNLSYQHELIHLATKCSITLIHFIEYLPADKIFYVAGNFCKKIGHVGLAYILLNKYVDICEAMDENNISIANSNNRSSPLPLIKSLPSSHYVLDPSLREETRDWVLSICMDSNINQELPPATESQGTIYAGLYPTTQNKCLVTGFPIEQNAKKVVLGNTFANESDFDEFYNNVRIHPWESENLSLEYIPTF